MAVTRPTASTLPDAKTLRDVRRRFLVVNRDRLNRAQETLKLKQRTFLELLPLIFHLNSEHLPGYVDKDTPFGISDYSPTRAAIDTAKKQNKRFRYRKRALRAYELESIFFIGSTGTVAYTDRSDFDIWLCHRPRMAPNRRADLQRKAAAVQDWAQSLDLEVHFFLMDANRFRDGELDALSQESSGSAQRHLLLDEFYRTSVLVAGKPLLWWTIPPDREELYYPTRDALVRNNQLREVEFIDFGPLSDIPAGEFVSAALWQIYKAIDSPYKSVLKIQLLESYADGSDTSDTLSRRYKQAVWDGTLQLDELDPYVMMCNKVEEYLISRGQTDRLELARRCFYYKVGEPLSKSTGKRRKYDWRREAMAGLAQRWHWDDAHLTMLDSRPDWKIHRVLDERKALVNEVTYSYRLLSDYAARADATNLIDPVDLNLLGRKLYTAFERKAGKVDLVNPGISRSLMELELSVHEVASPDEMTSWVLYRGKVDRTEALRNQPLRRAHSVVELLAWSHFNGLIGPHTRLYLQTRINELTIKELREVADALQRLYPDGQAYIPDMDDLGRPARVIASALYINLGIDPMAELTRQGYHLVSEWTDALNYGGARKNLALSFDQILITSWGEVLTYRYEGLTGLLDCLCQYLKWAPPSVSKAPPAIAAFSFSHSRGTSIARRIEELFSDVIHCYYTERRLETTRYLFEVEHRYLLLRLENDLFHHQRSDTLPELLELLATPHREYSPTVVDPRALSDTPVPLIFETDRERLIQVYYHVRAQRADIYIADEKSSLFHQEVEYFDSATLLNQLSLFIDAVRRRRNLMTTPDGNGIAVPRVEYFEIVRDRNGLLRLKVQEPGLLGPPINYLSIQVISEETADGHARYTVYCRDREFSSLQFGTELFREVARFIVEQRSSGERYPIYITDIDISGMGYDQEGELQRQTIHYLNFKKSFEERLNRALSHL
ncbi:MAG: adenylate cyclase [Proteobacteria bacterium]|nr:MAG: adenylate cyclase [Pseudomonadota bacterium]